MTRAFETLLRCFFLKRSALSYMKPLILCPPHSKMSASFLLYPSASPKGEKVINDYQDCQHFKILNLVKPSKTKCCQMHLKTSAFILRKSACSVRKFWQNKNEKDLILFFIAWPRFFQHFLWHSYMFSPMTWMAAHINSATKKKESAVGLVLACAVNSLSMQNKDKTNRDYFLLKPNVWFPFSQFILILSFGQQAQHRWLCC